MALTYVEESGSADLATLLYRMSDAEDTSARLSDSNARLMDVTQRTLLGKSRSRLRITEDVRLRIVVPISGHRLEEVYVSDGVDRLLHLGDIVCEGMYELWFVNEALGIRERMRSGDVFKIGKERVLTDPDQVEVEIRDPRRISCTKKSTESDYPDGVYPDDEGDRGTTYTYTFVGAPILSRTSTTGHVEFYLLYDGQFPQISVTLTGQNPTWVLTSGPANFNPPRGVSEAPDMGRTDGEF